MHRCAEPCRHGQAGDHYAPVPGACRPQHVFVFPGHQHGHVAALGGQQNGSGQRLRSLGNIALRIIHPGANHRVAVIFGQLILIDRSAVAEDDREATLQRDAVGSHLAQQSFVVPGLHGVNQGGGAGQRFGLGPGVCGSIL